MVPITTHALSASTCNSHDFVNLDMTCAGLDEAFTLSSYRTRMSFWEGSNELRNMPTASPSLRTYVAQSASTKPRAMAAGTGASARVTWLLPEKLIAWSGVSGTTGTSLSASDTFNSLTFAVPIEVLWAVPVACMNSLNCSKAGLLSSLYEAGGYNCSMRSAARAHDMCPAASSGRVLARRGQHIITRNIQNSPKVPPRIHINVHTTYMTMSTTSIVNIIQLDSRETRSPSQSTNKPEFEVLVPLLAAMAWSLNSPSVPPTVIDGKVQG
mmetsp:Transcript_107451/g.299358  ORF Transcript_107451/g.299358 Transcript_107451/m.299358 type:complete len:269 (-) Transcript_107451:538-1344(-)